MFSQKVRLENLGKKKEELKKTVKRYKDTVHQAIKS